ncbi:MULTISPECIES: universal stress protein [Methylocystis]|uniref:Universal stress protein n=1 Tax=Methylocystis iwaonis TaxID=2885079 RepID=A0ABM8ECJ7_9HYPH|nr:MULTISPECIES: universal stress protein [Methylocystis]MBL1256030.1 universal stress protein [Methylocystis sp. Sn-Cys]MDJ0450294.1 universal stress protein [Methylocystis sp. JR02]BDV35662.1 universal stress protein UspA [Methylocystis iwaonis]
MYKKILVPVDLGEADMTRIGLDAALSLAKAAPEAQLRLVSVQPLVPVAFVDYIPPNFDEEMRLAAERDLADVAGKVDLPAGRVSSTVRFGAVYPEVLAEAEDWGADLIVVGSHRPTMATYLLGSNAKTIVRHAKCSVLVVRQ